MVAVEGLKGYIYIESYKQQFVKQAIEDIGNLRIGKWQQLMVPIKEMTDVLRVVKDTTGIKRGSWVRIKRSVYKDDIAQVGVVGWAWLVHCDVLCWVWFVFLGGLCGHIQESGCVEDDPQDRLHAQAWSEEGGGGEGGQEEEAPTCKAV